MTPISLSNIVEWKVQFLEDRQVCYGLHGTGQGLRHQGHRLWGMPKKGPNYHVDTQNCDVNRFLGVGRLAPDVAPPSA